MLQQILKDMYIDPDVLNALNDDQKKTLFLKMRQEQVRRWKEREEKLELEERCAESRRPKPRKANSKSVNWLLGRDGDVAVIVIGEVDELTSKFICSGMGEKKTPTLQSSAYHRTILKTRKGVEPSRSERETTRAQPGISLELKGKCEETAALRSLSVSLSEQSPHAAGGKPELQSLNASEETSGLESSSCSRPPTRISPVTVRAASANVAPGCVNTRSGLTNPRLATATASPSPNSTVQTDCEAASPTKGSSDPQEPHKSLGPQGRKDNAASLEIQRAASEEAVKSGSNPGVAGRGRVAQLMKTFSCDGPTQTPTRGVKPPLPTKPGHLRVTATPTVR